MSAEAAVRAAKPLALAPRYVLAGLLAVAVGAVHLSHRPPSLCVLRTVTGIPCPFCGGTTAAADLGRGDLRGAVAASPLAVGLFALGPMLLWRSSRPRWAGRTTGWLVIGAILVGSELWQLVRFGIISL